MRHQSSVLGVRAEGEGVRVLARDLHRRSWRGKRIVRVVAGEARIVRPRAAEARSPRGDVNRVRPPDRDIGLIGRVNGVDHDFIGQRRPRSVLRADVLLQRHHEHGRERGVARTGSQQRESRGILERIRQSGARARWWLPSPRVLEGLPGQRVLEGGCLKAHERVNHLVQGVLLSASDHLHSATSEGILVAGDEQIIRTDVPREAGH